MAYRIHQKYHIKITTSLHSLHSSFAQLYTLTTRSFLRRCWSTNSHGFRGVDQSQWKLQTNTRAAVSDVSTNNLKALILTHHICACDSACVWVYVKESGRKWERDCVCVIEFQRHYSIRFTRAITVTLAIKQRSLLLSKVHIRSYCGERVWEGERESVMGDGG